MMAAPDVAVRSMAGVLKAAAADGERCRFNVGRVTGVLKRTHGLSDSSPAGAQLRFLRDLAYAWLDAHDRAARDVIRKAIADYLPTLKIEVPS